MNQRTKLIALWLAPTIVGLLVGATFMLTPLPTMDAFGSPVGWCGPGATSTNAVHVLLNPSVVNEDGGTVQRHDREADMALRSYCVGAAQDRVIYAGISTVAGVVIGLGMCVVMWLVGYRRPPAPPTRREIRVPYPA